MNDSDAEYPITIDPTWSLQIKVVPTDGYLDDKSGWYVALDGNTALVSSHLNDGVATDAGAVYVFVRSGTSWTFQQKLVASDGAAEDQFGLGIDLDGDTAVVGAYMDDDYGTDSGSAYFFVRSGTTWIQQQKVTSSDATDGDYFGASVAIEGDTAIIGAYGDDVGGAVYVYSRNSSSTWVETQKTPRW